jgi:UDP-N-acetylglucosamine 3-dehydrogenase
MLEFYRESKSSSHDNMGIVFESSINDIDAANWIFDEMPVMVFARLFSLNNEKEDFASIMLGYKDNKTAIILSNGFSSEKIRKLRAICSRAVVLSDLISQEIKVSKENSQVSLEKKDPILLQIQNFIGAIEGKNELVVKPKEVINITKIAEAALLSSKQGVPIYLDLK